MDPDDLRTLLRRTGADLWDLIDASISLAARDHPLDLRARRDAIVEHLYTSTTASVEPRSDARDVDPTAADTKPSASSPSTPQSVNRDDEDVEPALVSREEDAEEEEEEEAVRYRRGGRDRRGDYVEDEENDDEDGETTKILAIEEQLEDPDQDEETVISLLQNLDDMDITFKALKKTDIGRHVNGLRKHTSAEVRRLVKILVRKWKDLVDDWVKFNSNEAPAAAIITDGDSPQRIPTKSVQNGYHVSEIGYSPSHPNGTAPITERNSWDSDPKPKVVPPRRAPTPPIKPQKPPAPLPSSAPAKAKEPQKDSLMDPERLASARRRLHENYQEAQNAKKQRTIQVMEINEIPKKKNVFYPKSKQGKHW